MTQEIQPVFERGASHPPPAGVARSCACWFATIDQAREIIDAWRRDYNESRPHMALA